MRIVKEAILSFALDPNTGKIDMDLIATGRSSATRTLVNEIREHILGVLAKSKFITLTSLLEVFRPKPGFTDNLLKEALSMLVSDADVAVEGTGDSALIVRQT